MIRKGFLGRNVMKNVKKYVKTRFSGYFIDKQEVMSNPKKFYKNEVAAKMMIKEINKRIDEQAEPKKVFELGNKLAMLHIFNNEVIETLNRIFSAHPKKIDEIKELMRRWAEAAQDELTEREFINFFEGSFSMKSKQEIYGRLREISFYPKKESEIFAAFNLYTTGKYR